LVSVRFLRCQSIVLVKLLALTARVHRRSQGCSGCTCPPGQRKNILGVIYRENL